MLRGQIELSNVELTVEAHPPGPNGAAMPGAKVLVIAHKNPDGSPLVVFLPLPAAAAKAVSAQLVDKPVVEVPGIVIPDGGGLRSV